jgi:hypothetical protein
MVVSGTFLVHMDDCFSFFVVVKITVRTFTIFPLAVCIARIMKNAKPKIEYISLIGKKIT